MRRKCPLAGQVVHTRNTLKSCEVESTLKKKTAGGDYGDWCENVF